MKKLLGLLAISTGLLIGCSTTATFFPIAGSLSQAKPITPIIATVDGIWGNTGKISLVLTGGEACSGIWSSVAPTSSSANIGFGTASISSNMASAWGSAYGSGFSVGNMASVNRGEAMLICNKGTTIQVEFFTGSGTANGYGVAKDSNGNVFKVLL